MKKFAAIVFCLLLSAACVLPAHAAAEEDAPSYARVTEEGVYFYSAPAAGAGLFILPRTYFVKIVGTAGEYLRVRYLDDSGDGRALEGYCRTDEVTPVSFTPQTPYLVYSVLVTYSAGEGAAPDSDLSEYTVSADYYGEFAYGSAACYYVRIGGKFGYVPASACSVVDYPENTEHLFEESPSDEGNSPQKSGAPGAAGIVLICVLAVAALGALYFLFRPAKAKKPVYDETEDVF